MSTQAVMGNSTPSTQKIEKKPVKFSNLLLGAGLNMFEVTTLGQPLEVVKTTMAANRTDTFAGAMSRIWGRGGALGCQYCLLYIMIYANVPQSTKVSSPGPGSKPPQKVPSSSSLHPKPSTMQRPSAPTTSLLVSAEACLVVSPRHTQPWVSAHA